MCAEKLFRPPKEAAMFYRAVTRRVTIVEGGEWPEVKSECSSDRRWLKSRKKGESKKMEAGGYTNVIVGQKGVSCGSITVRGVFGFALCSNVRKTRYSYFCVGRGRGRLVVRIVQERFGVRRQGRSQCPYFPPPLLF